MIRTAAALALTLIALPASAKDAPFRPDCARIDAFLGTLVADGRTVRIEAVVGKTVPGRALHQLPWAMGCHPLSPV